MKDKIKLYLVTGKAGVGKSTYSQELVNNINAIPQSIAKPIKEIALEMGWDGQKDKHGRSLLQSLGREGRELHYHLWVNMLLGHIFWLVKRDKYERKIYRFVVSDVRFDDEIEYFKSALGDENVEVHRIHRKDYESDLTKEQQNDITERGVSDHLVDKEVWL